MIKKTIMAVLALVVALVIAVVFLGTNLDSLIKAGVEEIGMRATKAPTTLQKVEVSLTTGNGTLQGFTMGNPEGFMSDSAIKIGAIAIELDPQSVMGEGPIVIRKILIDGPELTYEARKNGTSNLQTIQNNIKSFANTIEVAKQKAAASGAAPPSPSASIDAKGAGRKIIVEQLIVSEGRVKLSHELLASEKLVDAKLPSIEMANIGRDTQGVTAAALAEEILQKLTDKAIEIGQAHIVSELSKQGLESLKGAVEESGIGKALGNLLGN